MMVDKTILNVMASKKGDVVRLNFFGFVAILISVQP